MDSATDRLKKMSRALGLIFEPQDWGIVNADGDRTIEFIAFFEKHSGLAPTLRFELGGLILASANEMLLKDPSADLTGVINFLNQNSDSFGAHIDYWRALREQNEYPLGSKLCET